MDNKNRKEDKEMGKKFDRKDFLSRLERRLDSKGCKGDIRYSAAILQEMGVPKNEIIHYVEKYFCPGTQCDCQIALSLVWEDKKFLIHPIAFVNEESVLAP